jgi:DNA-binding NtrC family response regulator
VEQVIGRLLLGDSPPMRRLRSLIARLAPSQASVLIQGPTGSGKELVAEALHLCSGRQGAFVPFNVCAVADGMFEAALFGHVRGAFTGAVQDTPGYLADADRGTAFLDEISGLSLAAQAKLLRAIETRSFRPVGARRDRSSDFRVVAASNEDLDALARAGRFRADLVHRLRAFVIRVPALADRLDDVPLLAGHFARRASPPPHARLTEPAIERLMAHSWPGNVRELRNVVEFALALADGLVVGAAEVTEALGADVSLAPQEDGLSTRYLLLSMLKACGGDTALVARQLGRHRSHVYRLMRQLGISTPRRRHLSTYSPSGAHADTRGLAPPDEFALFAPHDANSLPVHANSEKPQSLS